jgi:formylglycine-generating enzyme required for sulfatase activity
MGGISDSDDCSSNDVATEEGHTVGRPRSRQWLAVGVLVIPIISVALLLVRKHMSSAPYRALLRPVASRGPVRVEKLSNGENLRFLFPDGVQMQFVRIPAGTFTMGSPATEEGHERDESPLSRITISEAFWMGIYEVTQEQFVAVMGYNPSCFAGKDKGPSAGPRKPAVNMLWNDATQFCRRLSERTGLDVRLPTEAQWEYACRSGSTTRFSFGDSDSSFAGYGWCYVEGAPAWPRPVGQKKPNAWGLFDMHGNVNELCSDWYGSSLGGDATDPKGPKTGKVRVVRGGSWMDRPGSCRSAYRKGCPPNVASFSTGFRVVVAAE